MSPLEPSGDAPVIAARQADPAPEADALTQWWCVGLPRRLAPWAPPLADACADGAWTAAWPAVSALAPVIALLAGMAAPFVPGLMGGVYTESFLFLAVVIAGSILSGPVGVMLVVGFVLASGHLHYWSGTPSPAAWPVRWLQSGGSQLVVDLLLVTLAVQVPRLARVMAIEAARRASSTPAGRQRAGVIFYAGGCALLVGLWCHAMIVLVRPVFVWPHGSDPTVAAIYIVQNRWPYLAVVAVAAVLARVWLEQRSARSARLPAILALATASQEARTARGRAWRAVPATVRVAAAAGVATLLLGGLYLRWVEPLAVWAVLTALGLWEARARARGKVPGRWTEAMSRLPVLARFVAALGLGGAIAWLILTRWPPPPEPNDFVPLLVATLVGMVVLRLAFPRPIPPAATPPLIPLGAPPRPLSTPGGAL